MNFRALLGTGIVVACHVLLVQVLPVQAKSLEAEPGFESNRCAPSMNQLATAGCINQILSQGRALVRQGNFAEALAFYQKAANLTHNNARVYSAIGFLQAHQQDFQAAAAAYQKAIGLEPNNARFYYALGFSQAQLGDYNEAELAYRRAIELTPMHADSHLSLGIVLARQGHHRRALLAYATALALQPTNAAVYQAIGVAHQALGKHQEATAFFDRAGQLSYSSRTLTERAENGLMFDRK